MKKTKFISVVVAAAMAMTLGLTACGNKNEIPQTPNDITLRYWRSGLGDAGIQEVIRLFNEKQSTYKVWFDPYTASSTGSTFGNPDTDPNDIYMMGISAGTEQLLLDYAEPLNDVLSYTPEGETGTIADKFPDYFLDAVRSSDNNYYKLSMGGGIYGIVYNTNIIDGVNYQVPTTTKELEELAMMLYEDRANGKDVPVAFMNTNEEGDYWKSVLTTAHAQYDGLDYYNETFLPLKAEDGTLNSESVLLKEDGRKKALEAYATIITPDYSFNGSLGEGYMDAQTRFLNGQSAMMANGTWLLNEMASTSTNFAMMKVPVISSIVEKCPGIDDNDDYTLRNLIKAIDAAETKDDVKLVGDGYSVTQPDLDIVWEARKTIYSNFDVHAVFVPEYSNAKEGAIEFLKFFYSDEGMTAYWNAGKGAQIFKLSGDREPDMTGWTDWQKAAQEMIYDSVSVFEFNSNMSPIFTRGGATPFANPAIYITNAFAAQRSVSEGGDRMSASEVWEIIRNWHDTNWTTYMTNAGL